MQLSEHLQTALQLQREGDLSTAESTLRRAIQIFGPKPDCLHLLGIVRARRGDLRDGINMVASALNECDWKVDAYKQNLALMTARLLRQRAALLPPSAKYEDYRKAVETATGRARANATVSAVLLTRGSNMRDLETSLDSVRVQTRSPDLVVVVTDNGDLVKLKGPHCPLDGIARLIEASNYVSTSDELARLVNLGIRATDTAYIQPLLAGDRLAPERVEVMYSECSRLRAAVGFSRVQVMAGGTVVDELSDPWVFDAACAQSTIASAPSVGLGLLKRDVSYGLSNLFLARDAFDALGGFNETVSQFSWSYLLRSLWSHEPCYVDIPLCQSQRVTLDFQMSVNACESQKAALEIERQKWWATAFDEQSAANPWAPKLAYWGDELFIRYLEGFASQSNGWVHLPMIVTKVLKTGN